MPATPITATPERSTVTWIVNLPDAKPFTLMRSLDGGTEWELISEISEAWTYPTFEDPSVPAVCFPLYNAIY